MKANLQAHARIDPRSVGSPPASTSAEPIGSSLPFFFYMAYVVSFFLHTGGRFPVIAPLRPDLVLAVLVILSIFPYLTNKAQLLTLPAAKALTTLIVFVIVSLPFVEWPGSVIRNNLQPFVKAALFFYFTALVVDTPRRLRIFVAIFVGCQVFRVLEPLYLNLTEGYTGDRTWVGGGFVGRLSGAPSDVINPNGLGFVIATSSVFLHFMLGQARSLILRIAYVGLLPAFLYALILTMSRGGFIALLVGAFLIFRQSQKKALLVVAAVAIAIAGWSIMSDVQKDRYLSLVSSDAEQSATAEGRIRGSIDEFMLGFNRPIFGHGLGTTREAKFHFGGGRQAAHNLYAEVSIELGFVGLALFLTFLARIYKAVKGNAMAVRVSKQANAPNDYCVRLNRACMTIFWVYAVYSINYFGLSQDYWYLFGGLCLALSTIVGSNLQNVGKRQKDVTRRVRAG